jgi:uncharacterized protein
VTVHQVSRADARQIAVRAQLLDASRPTDLLDTVRHRRCGYWAMPILYSDRLVGKIDATTDRKAGVLRVDAIHRDVPFTKTMTDKVIREVTDLAHWLDADLLLPA